jgi:hypothetical protein
MSIFLALLGAHVATATATYPSTIESELAMPCLAPCTICHTTNAGGTGTVLKPFGLAMKDRGLVGLDLTSLTDALAQMTADNVDSDGDGVIDTQALTDGLDPNDGSSLCSAILPKYGCIGGGPIAGVGFFFIPVIARRRRSDPLPYTLRRRGV